MFYKAFSPLGIVEKVHYILIQTFNDPKKGTAAQVCYAFERYYRIRTVFCNRERRSNIYLLLLHFIF